jgi:hypothetical protein
MHEIAKPVKTLTEACIPFGGLELFGTIWTTTTLRQNKRRAVLGGLSTILLVSLRNEA